MRTDFNSPLPILPARSILLKAVVLLTGFHLLAINYFHYTLQTSSDTPHTVNNSVDPQYSSKDRALYDFKSQKLMVNHSREAVSKQDRTTFRYAILSPMGDDNIQLYCTALEQFEARIAIKNVIGEALMVEQHRFKQGNHVLEFDVSDWPAGRYLVQIQGGAYNKSKKFEVNHEPTVAFASQIRP